MADLARVRAAAAQARACAVSTAFVLGLGALAACGGSARPVSVAPYLRVAEAYESAEAPRPVLNANAERAAEIERALQAAAREAGLELRGDGRLGLLAQRLVQEPAGDARALAASARSFGVPEVAIEQRIVRSAGREPLADVLARELVAPLRALSATHFGAYIAADGQSASVVLTRRLFVLVPVPRRLAATAPLIVRGRLSAALRDPKLSVSSAAGALTLPAGEGPDFDVRIPTRMPGQYRVLLEATAADRRVTLAELVIGVGVASSDVIEAPPPPRALAEVADDLYARVVALRAAGGVAPLHTHAGLQRRAERLSAELARGAADDPAQSALSLHVTARARDAQALWDAWQRDASARSLLLSPEVSHLGVGVADASDGFVATAVVAQLTQVALDDLSPARLLIALNRNRGARGGRALRPDPELTRVADDAAREFFAHPERSEREIMQRANGELDRFGLAYGRVTALAVLVADPSEAAALEPALDPRARAVGIAIARGDRPDSVAGSVAVVIALGYEREP
jgi:hypothetical protein